MKRFLQTLVLTTVVGMAQTKPSLQQLKSTVATPCIVVSLNGAIGCAAIDSSITIKVNKDGTLSIIAMTAASPAIVPEFTDTLLVPVSPNPPLATLTLTKPNPYNIHVLWNGLELIAGTDYSISQPDPTNRTVTVIYSILPNPGDYFKAWYNY